MLRVEGLSQFYGKSNILRDVDLDVPDGECTCLMGRNGVGKTTLLRCLMGLTPNRAGKILYKDRDITRLRPEERARLGIGYVPQGRQIFPLLTVGENLQVGLPARRKPTKGIPSFVYGFFPVLKEMLGRRGGDLSGGQQQQLAIARALVLEPEFLILDEPTEGIQPNIVQGIIATVKRLIAEMGMTVLQVEQKVPVARKAGDRYAIMERGHIVDSGDMADLSEEKIRNFLSV
ncbi:MAG: urea ABC transporter ATP-binding subunit UrtE [Deltaproteobacteria bacterium]|jgi:urea transport system ATP-binding protein|nr:urea ABC transporter ATP-binding subunit UrtE [Deltaproteobacteria bacterium]